MTRETKLIELLSDQLNDIVSNYTDGVFLPDLDSWATADIVQMSTIMDSELQRRADEEIRNSEMSRH
jgi:hypothetical protein